MADNKTTSTVTMDDGVRLNVKILGQDSAGSKPLLISLHGAPGLSTLAEPEASFGYLANLYRVLVFDARGSGASDKIGPFTHDRWIEDIEILRKWAGAETFILAGASYGGFIALDYAIKHGDRLQGLILRDTWANGKVGPMNALANILTSNRVKVDVARQVRLWSGTSLNDQDHAEGVQEILPIFTPPPEIVPPKEQNESTEFQGSVEFYSATQNAAFSENMPRFDVRHRLKEIKTPTLVIVGRHDYIAPVACSEEIANAIPNARLEIFELSGHSPPSDEPEKFERILSSFLKSEI
ncbi:proline iminopeptidase [Talaromyces proteolyticus]|uniref:Proline iminopeptidase n=1 Tax=Talaromyces proteolyticus TaxID=1131652 RepID=A0AAD4KJM8_9EURO|nr:proline iminopeptidase [Talaromyces proteolyticus]KAH8690782.1 proline iminopeptidase [Talaromyces proteolyticus]